MSTSTTLLACANWPLSSSSSSSQIRGDCGCCRAAARPLRARLIGIVARGGASKGFPGGVGEDSFGVGEVCAQGFGRQCGGMLGRVDGGPDELLGGSEPQGIAVFVRQCS